MPQKRSDARPMLTLGPRSRTAFSPERIISFGRQRAKAGAGPATLSADISYIHTIISHSAAVHGVKISTEEIDLARIALRRLDLIGRSNERDRRPTQTQTLPAAVMRRVIGLSVILYVLKPARLCLIWRLR